MWWPGSFATWEEAHNSPGATTTGVLWGVADGEVGGDAQYETYVLVANQSTAPATVEVTLLFEGLPTVSKVFAVPPTSRFNVATGIEFPDAQGRRFGVIVRSTGATPTPIVVERAIYSTANGVAWGAGGAALAAKLQ
jgi:hypothetical protein